MTGLLFVTALEADHKTINLALVYLHDWHYGAGDCFKVVLSKDPKDLLRECEEETEGVLDATEPPVLQDLVNEWTGASVEEVERFCLKLEENGERTNKINSHLFVIFDAKSQSDKTFVLGERAMKDEDDEDEDEVDDYQITYLDSFNKLRTPLHHAYLNWCNLNIANMGFEDFAKMEGGADNDFWWEYNNCEKKGDSVFTSKKSDAKRDAKMEELREEGGL